MSHYELSFDNEVVMMTRNIKEKFGEGVFLNMDLIEELLKCIIKLTANILLLEAIRKYVGSRQ